MTEKIYTYKGRPLAELSRDELLTALRWAYDTIAADREFHRVNAEMEREFAETARLLALRRSGLRTNART